MKKKATEIMGGDGRMYQLAKINKINIVTKSKRVFGSFKWNVVYFVLIGLAFYLGYLATGLILTGLYMHKKLL